MKKALSFVFCALFVLAIAAPAAADSTASQAVRSGTAPTVEELMQRVSAPQAFGGEKEVLNRVPDSLQGRPPVITTADPLAQSAGSITQQAPTAGVSFGGYDSDDNASQFGFRIMPPDTEGDVGLTHYVQYNNLGWKYWDKATQTENGPFPGNIFWQGFGGVCDTDNAGDPIVLYDQFADRWVFSQFTDPGNPDGHQCFAVTQGNDPAGPYYLYDFVVSPGQFNDYEKITVWTDGAGQSAYHMSSNEFAAQFAGVNATAFDRDAMLAGSPASFVQFSLGTATAGNQNFSLQPAHLEGNAVPPAGTCNKYIMAFDQQTWGTGPGADGYRIWTYCVDFNTPANSTFAETAFITSAGFDAELCGYSRDCVAQPGTAQRLDVLGQFTMYRFANRYFPGSGLEGVISHTVDTGGDVAGVRWAHIDVDNDALIDSGTLAPGDGVSRWMPSASIDSAGNIGISFTKSSSSVRPSVYFAGREAGDPAGTLQGEVVCIDGTGSQLGGNRWGDYASASVDPADDCTFWITNEYVETTGSFQWDTQVCSYSFASCTGGGQVCGNNTIEGTEVCDGTDLGGATCGSEGCTGGGTLACNGTCDGFDTSGCFQCPVCDNDGTCEVGEDCNNCSNDCVSGTASGAVCGNGICEAGNGEAATNCSADCNGKLNGKPSNRFSCGLDNVDGLAPNGCGDSRCTTGGFQCTETPVSGGSFCCGDAICEPGEDSSNCALDCGAEPFCGDGTCNGSEDQCSCALDCGAAPPNEVPNSTCDDGIDNDCDVAVDCNDTDCGIDPSCICLPKNDSCTFDLECCSGNCKNNGRCR